MKREAEKRGKSMKRDEEYSGEAEYSRERVKDVAEYCANKSEKFMMQQVNREARRRY